MARIELEREGPIATITIDRPQKLNALTLEMYRELGAAFAAVRDDEAVEVVILTGAGERAFCVGADLTESIPALAEDRFDISEWDPAHLKHARFHKPIVGAINGLCLGGGFEIMLATDIRIAAEGAQFGIPEPGLGFVPAGGTLARLTRQVPYTAAMEVLITGERFDAERALRLTLLNRVVAGEELMVEAWRWAERIAALSPGAVQTIKEAALGLHELPLDDAFREEALLGQRTFTSEDAREGLAAFTEGREANLPSHRRRRR